MLPQIFPREIETAFTDYFNLKNNSLRYLGCFFTWHGSSHPMLKLQDFFKTIGSKRTTQLNDDELSRLIVILTSADPEDDSKTMTAFQPLIKKFGALWEQIKKADKFLRARDLQLIYSQPDQASRLIDALRLLNSTYVKHYEPQGLCDGAPLKLRNLIYQFPDAASAIATEFSKLANSKIVIEKIIIMIEKNLNLCFPNNQNKIESSTDKKWFGLDLKH